MIFENSVEGKGDFGEVEVIKISKKTNFCSIIYIQY